MKVKLLSYTPNPELIVASAAKLCYSPVGVDEIQEKLSDEEIIKFVSMLSSMGHHSPLEHVSFTFAVEGISRACSHQIVRHRIASYSQQSQRYVKLKNFEYIVPKAIQDNTKAKSIFLKAMEQDQENYDSLVEQLMCDYFKKLGYEKEYLEFLYEIDDIADTDSDYLDQYFIWVKNNHKEEYSSIEKKSIEDARYVFPNACETKMVFTMNVRTLLNFFTHRCCVRAQSEIRELAFYMLKEVKAIAPTLFKKAGPTCIRENCKEGSMSCKN